MNLYAIFRRDAWDADQLEAVDSRSNAEAANRTDQLRKVRSYVLDEGDGRVGTICLYMAESPEAVVEHAEAADLVVSEVVPINAIDVARPDPDQLLT